MPGNARMYLQNQLRLIKLFARSYRSKHFLTFYPSSDKKLQTTLSKFHTLPLSKAASKIIQLKWKWFYGVLLHSSVLCYFISNFNSMCNFHSSIQQYCSYFSMEKHDRAHVISFYFINFVNFNIIYKKLPKIKMQHKSY